MKERTEIHNNKNNINAGGRKGVAKKNPNKVIKIKVDPIATPNSVILASLLFVREPNKVKLVRAKDNATNK
jgi:hypothetical protein